MPETYRIRYTLRAADHLREIFDYIERDSPRNATRMIERLLNAIDSLDTMPHRYNVVNNSEQLGEDVRSMSIRPYLIRYHVDERERVVTILSARHAARRPDL